MKILFSCSSYNHIARFPVNSACDHLVMCVVTLRINSFLHCGSTFFHGVPGRKPGLHLHQNGLESFVAWI